MHERYYRGCWHGVFKQRDFRGQRVEQPLLCVIAFYLAVFAHYVINGDRNYISPIAIQLLESKLYCYEGACRGCIGLKNKPCSDQVRSVANGLY